ncbi:hypothetical protein SeMB42_g04405 [Synchytrium endobioticum]|uniref:Uncharacterized protein n=1 Tax=Synchytrium endobioticum TaxID=286115 RepID=A0A507CYM4_9FUNG|nr:hypothetical protein SeMB42_g04405 [Synchytrium endobioticum]
MRKAAAAVHGHHLDSSRGQPINQARHRHQLTTQHNTPSLAFHIPYRLPCSQHIEGPSDSVGRAEPSTWDKIYSTLSPNPPPDGISSSLSS